MQAELAKLGIHISDHGSLAQDCPKPRAIDPPNQGEIVELPFLGGLHHRYTRQAA